MKLHLPLFTSDREKIDYLKAESKRLRAAVRRFESHGLWAYADECEAKLSAVEHRLTLAIDDAALHWPAPQRQARHFSRS